MKRSEELSPLSRDHHRALAAALRLRRADDSSAAEAVDAFLAFWRDHGERHFRIEEDVLLPAFALGGGNPHDELVARTLTDHVEIRALAGRLGSSFTPAEARELGERLNAHVRMEENELFPLIEETLEPDALARLGEQVASAESDAG